MLISVSRQTRFGVKRLFATLRWVNLKQPSSLSFSVPVWMQARLPSDCVMPMPNWVILASASTGVRSWISMFFRIRLNTGDQQAWYFSGISRYGICRSWVIPGLPLPLNVPGPVLTRVYMPTVLSSQGVRPRFPLPDLSGEYRYAGKFGYIELAGILRYISWEDHVG